MREGGLEQDARGLEHAPGLFEGLADATTIVGDEVPAGESRARERPDLASGGGVSLRARIGRGGEVAPVGLEPRPEVALRAGEEARFRERRCAVRHAPQRSSRRATMCASAVLLAVCAGRACTGVARSTTGGRRRWVQSSNDAGSADARARPKTPRAERWNRSAVHGSRQRPAHRRSASSGRTVLPGGTPGVSGCEAKRRASAPSGGEHGSRPQRAHCSSASRRVVRNRQIGLARRVAVEHDEPVGEQHERLVLDCAVDADAKPRRIALDGRGLLLGAQPQRNVGERADGQCRGPCIVVELGAVGVGVCRDHGERRLGLRPAPRGKERGNACGVGRTGEVDAFGACRGANARCGPSPETSAEGLEVAEVVEVGGRGLAERAHHGPRGGTLECAPRGLGEGFEHGQTLHGQVPRGAVLAERRAQPVEAFEHRGAPGGEGVDGEPRVRERACDGATALDDALERGPCGVGAPGQHLGDDAAHPRLGAVRSGPSWAET